MGPWLSVGMLVLAGWAALKPAPMAWLYLAGAFAFEAWLLGMLRSVGSAPVEPGRAPYLFSEEEARLVGRYRFYFTYPRIAKHASSVLAAIGLTALGLAPWLTFRGALAAAALVALDVVAVGWLTRRVAPLMALGAAAKAGSREAMDLMASHHSAWEKIRQGNQSPAR